jgi:hypothetical protein
MPKTVRRRIALQRETYTPFAQSGMREFCLKDDASGLTQQRIILTGQTQII